jgi:hypothetical protein
MVLVEILLGFVEILPRFVEILPRFVEILPRFVEKLLGLVVPRVLHHSFIIVLL